VISQAESSHSVQQVNMFASDITDIFTDESYYILLIELQNNITTWREKAEYENKLVKQE
jgi:hypothetical protein